MVSQLCFLTCSFFIIAQVATRPALGQPDTTAKEEPGVRLRVYRLAAPQYRIRSLARNQSANLDQTIDSFELTGRESFWKNLKPPFMVRLNAILEVDEDEEFRFRLHGSTHARLLVDEEPVVTVQQASPVGIGVSELDEGEYPIEIWLIANNSIPKLDAEWAVEDEPFEPITDDALTTKAFYFRPTAPGVKQLATDDDRPGLHQKVAGLYPGLNIATIRPPDTEVPVGGLATLADGTLVVAVFDAETLKAPVPTVEPNGQLWLYHNPAGDPREIRREKIADGLYEPAGVCTVGKSIYVSQRSEITHFQPSAASGAWQATTVATGWETNDFHAISFGLLHEPVAGDHPGFLYMAKGTGLGLKRNPPNHGSVWRVDLSKPADESVEAITGGHRTPNGLAWGPAGTMFVTDNQGEYTPVNELNLVREGAFYGFFQKTERGGEPAPFQPDAEGDENICEAAVWFPQDEIGNSPSQPLMIPDGWPFAGQMLVGDVKYGGVNRVSLDNAGEVWQGAVYRFTQGCEGGVNRLAFGADGSLYVGAIGGRHGSTWAWVNPQGKSTFHGLQRMQPNGHNTFDIERVRPTADGFSVRFTKPVERVWLNNASNYEVHQWTYRATPKYGGPKKELEQLRVRSANPTEDGMGAELKIDGLKPNRVVHFVVDPTSVEGEEIWSAEAWYTLRKIPR